MSERPPCAYRSPQILPLGKAADLTSGSGEIEVDYLGNTKTYYGKWINEPGPGPVPAVNDPDPPPSPPEPPPSEPSES